VVLDGPHDDVKYFYEARTIQPFSDWRGPGQCRDYAIRNSKAKYIIMVDGHMTFPPGWVDVICAHLDENPKDITCCLMQGLDQNWMALPERIYSGCHLALKHTHDTMKNWWLYSTWNKEEIEKGKIGSLMGACYGITKAWYKKIGSPLAILRGWGGDEEILSACTWLMGGRCFLLPPICGHIWAAKRLRPDKLDYHETWELWANHYAMLDALPVPSEEYAKMKEHINKAHNKQRQINEILMQRHEAIQHLRETLQKAPHDWQWLKKNGIIK
jgi:glycosyltransferase involved in cell wall biosynthesis